MKVISQKPALKNHQKMSVTTPFFNKVVGPTIFSKKDTTVSVSLWILRNFSEQILYRNPANDSFCSIAVTSWHYIAEAEITSVVENNCSENIRKLLNSIVLEEPSNLNLDGYHLEQVQSLIKINSNKTSTFATFKIKPKPNFSYISRYRIAGWWCRYLIRWNAKTCYQIATTEEAVKKFFAELLKLQEVLFYIQNYFYKHCLVLC